MEKVTQFKAEDGRLFANKTECLKYDAKLHKRDKLIRMILPKQFDNCDFANGGGYIQLTPETKKKFMDGYVSCIRVHHPAIFKELDVSKNPTGFIGRYLCDGDLPFYRLWCLACQIDKSGRLWGQAYYATHQSEAKQDVLCTR